MASSDEGRRYIVGIGVGEYDLPQLRLPQVAADVENITAWFQRHPRLAHQRALPELSDNPTWEAMQGGLRNWLADRRPNDVIVIYIAAHGEYEAGRAYLFGRNTPQRQLAGAAMEAQTLGAMLGQFLVHNVLIIIDACVAGKLASEVQRASEDAAYESNTREPRRAWAQVLLCSTFGRDPALDGKFAQAFIRVVNSEKWTGTTQPWIDIDQLMRGINEELRSISTPQIAERKVWGPSPAELIPNPNFAARTLGTLVAEGEFATHFDPSSRGVSRGEAGRFFSGRSWELRRIASWLHSADADGEKGKLLVLTGSPGSGKSALLSRAVVLSDPSLRQRAGDLSALPADTLPPLDAFGGVVWCHNKSLRQVVGEIGQRFGRSVDSAQALLEAANGQRLTLAIDALDEALQGEAVEIARQVIAPLVVMPGIHILVATRRQPVRGQHDRLDLLGRMGADPAHTIVLDDAIDQVRDMQDYVSARLCASTGLSAAGYRADAALARRVAQRVATAAGSSFLVAALTAKTLAVSDTLTEADNLVLPSAVGEAMAAYIERLPSPQRVRDVLRALAWASGSGLPWGDLWPRLATALAAASRTDGQTPSGFAGYDDADVQAALEGAGDLIVESVEDGGPVYRLFHEALAEHLRRDTPAAVAHAAIADTLMLEAAGRPWTGVHPYVVANLTAHLARASDRIDTLIRLVCDPVWERARRTQTRGATQWLDDVDLVMQLLANVSTQDLRQVGLCVVCSRKLATAPVPVLEVLARAGQLQRAERMANNLGSASDRVQAHCMLATCYAQVADPESASRCLAQASHAVEVMQGVHAPMAMSRLCAAFLDCKHSAQAGAAAGSALDIALKLKINFEASGDISSVPNALFWAALALRRVADFGGLSSLRTSLAALNPSRNMTLQLAGVLGEAAFLRRAFDKLKIDCSTKQRSSIRAGDLALAFSEAGMTTEFEELLAIVPPRDAAKVGGSAAQKHYVWALAMAGHMDDALLALDVMDGAEDRVRAAVRVAEVAERGGRRDILDRLADRLLSWSAPHDNNLDALTALVLSIAARHDAALTIVEDLMLRPQAAADFARQRNWPMRPLTPKLIAIEDEQILPWVERMLREGRFDEALQRALAVGRTEGGASHTGGDAQAWTAGNMSAIRATALNLLVPHAPDPSGALKLWLEALRTARLAGHLAVGKVLKNGALVVNLATAGKTWEVLTEEVSRLERRWDLENFAEQYDALRSAFGSGQQRTARMTNLMLVPRRQGLSWQRDDVNDALTDANPAKRLFVLGLMRGNLAILNPQLVIEAIMHSNSAFEQFHAILLASERLSGFNAEQKRQLLAALLQELSSDGVGRGQIKADSSRRELAQGLLVRLQSMTQ